MLFERAGDSIFVVRDGHFVDCNAATLAMFGCTREQIIGEHARCALAAATARWPRFARPGDGPDRGGRIGQVQFFEWQHRRCDGSLFDAEVSPERGRDRRSAAPDCHCARR